MDPSYAPPPSDDPYTYTDSYQPDYTDDTLDTTQQAFAKTSLEEEKTMEEEYQGQAYQSDVNPPQAAPYVDNPYNDGQHYDDTQQLHDPSQSINPHSRTFITGLDVEGGQTQQQQTSQQEGPAADAATSSLLDEIAATESYMMEYERTAQYVEAERARQKLMTLKARYRDTRHQHLSTIQQEDIRVFFSMVAQHQDNFDKTWAKKILEHKLRADDLIDALKWKHDDQQRQLYEQLRKKRMPKFSVELLNMRKRQVLLAKARQYIQAEKIKRKADMLEAIEIERIRESAKEENQMRFEALLKRQQWDRASLANKLKIEKKCLLEAKAQDFLRLKKRLRNAEQELRKTHIRQQLHADKKLTPQIGSTNHTYAANQTTPRTTRSISSSAATARSSAALRAAGSSVASAPATRQERTMRKSARELAAMGRTDTTHKWDGGGGKSERTSI